MQNEVLPDLIGPLTIQENECLNFRTSSLMDGQGAITRPSSKLPYLYRNGTDVLSPNRRLVENEIM